MSVNLIPGYDFTIHEMVTHDKLMAWISGTHNDGTLTLADLGLEFPVMSVAATRTSAVTEGTLQLDSTHGLMCIMSRWGMVPVAMTRGGMFTRRITLDDGDHATARNWYGLNNSLYRDLGLPGAVACPTSTYSAGEHLIGFGNAWHALCIDTLQTNGYLRGCSIWPSEDHLANGLTVNSSATMFHYLFAIGGFLPLLATCATNGFTAPSISSAAGNLVVHGAAAYVTAADTTLKFGVDARNGERVGVPASYQKAYVYPHWEVGTVTVGWTQNRFY